MAWLASKKLAVAVNRRMLIVCRDNVFFIIAGLTAGQCGVQLKRGAGAASVQGKISG